MKSLRTAIDFVVYSNLFIALGAVAMVLTSRLTAGEPLQFDQYCWFVFFATALAYSLLKYERDDDKVAYTVHQSWAQQHAQLFRNLMLIGLIGTGAFFLKLDTPAQLMTIILGIFTAFYGYLHIPFRGKKYKLREMGLVKTMFVGLVWSFTTVLVPFAGKHLAADMLVFLLLRRFLFVLALTIPFEIKDLWIDRASNITTLPQRIGISGTKRLAQGVLVLLIGINLLQYFFFYVPLADMIAFNLSLAVSIACIQPVTEHTGDKWYYLVLDGMMPLQFVFVFVAHKWFM